MTKSLRILLSLAILWSASVHATCTEDLLPTPTDELIDPAHPELAKRG